MHMHASVHRPFSSDKQQQQQHDNHGWISEVGLAGQQQPTSKKTVRVGMLKKNETKTTATAVAPGKMVNWQNGKLAKWQNGKKASWQKGTPIRCSLHAFAFHTLQQQSLCQVPHTKHQTPKHHTHQCHATTNKQTNEGRKEGRKERTNEHTACNSSCPPGCWKLALGGGLPSHVEHPRSTKSASSLCFCSWQYWMRCLGPILVPGASLCFWSKNCRSSSSMVRSVAAKSMNDTLNFLSSQACTPVALWYCTT